MTGCIQPDMYAKRRCVDCVESYKGHRSGEYHVKLKACYVRNERTQFVKIGYWCPKCHRFYDNPKVKS